MKKMPLFQDLSPDRSDQAAAVSNKSAGSTTKPPSALLLAVAGLGVALTIATAGAQGEQGQVGAFDQRTPVDLALYVDTSKLLPHQVNQGLFSQQIAQVEGITIEVEMPKNVRGSLNTDVVFVFEATSDGEWKEQPVADVVVGNTITYVPPPGARTLGFIAGDATAAIDLEPGFVGRICLELDTSSRSDFLQSLGYRRSTTITGIKPALTDQATCSAYFASANRSRGAAS